MGKNDNIETILSRQRKKKFIEELLLNVSTLSVLVSKTYKKSVFYF